MSKGRIAGFTHSLETRKKISDTLKEGTHREQNIENGKRLNRWLKNNPAVLKQKAQNLRKYAKKHPEIGEHLINHPNTIKSRFKTGEDKRREAKRNWSQEVRDAQAKRMSKLASEQLGEKHPNWRGGITPINQNIRNGKRHREWAINVYKKDKFTCQDCDKFCKKGNIIAHHMKPFSDNIDDRFDIKNGITMCRGCHVAFHSRERKTQRLLFAN